MTKTTYILGENALATISKQINLGLPAVGYLETD